MQEGTLAAYSMFRGFLNAMEHDTDPGGVCSRLAICEGARWGKKGRQLLFYLFYWYALGFHNLGFIFQIIFGIHDYKWQYSV